MLYFVAEDEGCLYTKFGGHVITPCREIENFLQFSIKKNVAMKSAFLKALGFSTKQAVAMFYTSFDSPHQELFNKLSLNYITCVLAEKSWLD